MQPQPLTLVALAYPNCTLLDLVGPYTALTALPAVQAGIYWKHRGQIRTDSGAIIFADRTFDEVPDQPTVLMVPGGTDGTFALLEDEETLDWLARVGKAAQWVTSVCSGALLLGAAGLLDGYKATSHWAVRDHLAAFGAIPTQGRVVADRNRMTGGGVTAGIDFGLTLAAQLAGENVAKAIQLGLEYSPVPPFQAGTPEQAGPDVVAQVLTRFNMTEAAKSVTAAANRPRRVGLT